MPKILAENSESKCPLAKYKRRWEDNTEMDFTGISDVRMWNGLIRIETVAW